MPKKQQQKATPKLGNVFGDNDTSDEDDGTDWVKKALRAEGEKNKMKKQTKLDIQKALNEDPTIYQYDEVYDDMERTKSQLEVSKQKEKKPRYIQKLLKTAERRKKEQEHRIGRMIQKEREAEGDMYTDKESFVTSAYRVKLEEFKKMEEEEARMNVLEAIGDVTKQQDMSGFYRHLYEQTVEYKGETNKDESNNTTEKDTKQEERANLSNEQREDDTIVNETPEELSKATVKAKKSRQYRKRAIETYESDSEMKTNKEDLKKDKIDTLSVNEGADKSEIQEPEKKKRELDKTDVNINESIAKEKEEANKDAKDAKISVNTNETAVESKEIEDKEEPVETKDRSFILEKRTIGPIFEAALQRYYARKAKRTVMV